MRRAMLAALVLVAGVAGASSSRPESGGGVRYRTVELTLASDAAIAAWQLELVADGDARVVGVEGGEAPFADPPAYDAAALSTGRIVLAAFDTRATLPAGKHRVAVVHLRESGAEPRYTVRLVAAGNAGGERVAATPSLEPRSPLP